MEAFEHPTIRRLTPSSRHQLSRIALGALIAHWEIDHWAVDAVGAPHVGDRTEKELITAFCDKIAELHRVRDKRLILLDNHARGWGVSKWLASELRERHIIIK